MEEQQRIPYDVFMAWAMNEEAGDKQPTPKLFLDKLMRTLALNVILQIAILVYSAFLIGYMASNADRTNEASNRHGATYLIVAAVSSIGCILMEICLSVAVSIHWPFFSFAVFILSMVRLLCLIPLWGITKDCFWTVFVLVVVLVVATCYTYALQTRGYRQLHCINHMLEPRPPSKSLVANPQRSRRRRLSVTSHQ